MTKELYRRQMYFLTSVLLCFHVLAVSVQGHSLNEQWQSWKKEHRVVFNTEQEEAERLGIWLDNMALIEEHNRQNHSFTLQMNHFGHLVQFIYMDPRTKKLP